MNFDFHHIRKEFPILHQTINSHPLIYFDNAATTQCPMTVIDAITHFYKHEYSAVHRGIHSLSSKATARIENIRCQIANFINACSAEEIIFVKGTTEGINLVANSWGAYHLQAGDNIIITQMEHHANIVPWQILAKKLNVEIRFLPINENGQLIIEYLDQLIDIRTRLLAVTHISNVLGTINPLKTIIQQSKSCGLVTLVDGAQAIMHHNVDVQDLDCDFYVFSGHKIYAPTGIGILYARKQLLDHMPPWQGGGGMINQVILPHGTIWNRAPWRFEAGTPNTMGIIGLGTAIEWIKHIGIDIIHDYEKTLMKYLLRKIINIPEIKIYGPMERSSIISFNLGNYHALDVGSFLDQQYGIAIRTGHHCAMPLMHYYKVSSMCRVSLALYNTKEEVNRLILALKKIYNVFKHTL